MRKGGEGEKVEVKKNLYESLSASKCVASPGPPCMHLTATTTQIKVDYSDLVKLRVDEIKGYTHS